MSQSDTAHLYVPNTLSYSYCCNFYVVFFVHMHIPPTDDCKAVPRWPGIQPQSKVVLAGLFAQV